MHVVGMYPASATDRTYFVERLWGQVLSTHQLPKVPII